jgi:hypothetical protein
VDEGEDAGLPVAVQAATPARRRIAAPLTGKEAHLLLERAPSDRLVRTITPQLSWVHPYPAF